RIAVHPALSLHVALPLYLRTWRDGWRHLSFLLMYSPRWLFLYPGLYLLGLGLAAVLILLPGAFSIVDIAFDIRTFIVACFCTLRSEEHTSELQSREKLVC